MTATSVRRLAAAAGAAAVVVTLAVVAEPTPNGGKLDLHRDLG